jgi:RNA polymerase sigma-70 factor (ECF subfamily)
MKSETTQLVASISAGDRSAVDRLFELVYDDLRRLARKYSNQSVTNKSLRPTEVVHEAFLKLVDQDGVDWRGKSHFMAVGAQAMRHILVDYARSRNRQKRGGDWRRVTFDEAATISIDSDEDIIAVDTALEQLAEVNSVRAKIVELRFFAGMTVQEVAEALHLSKRTVEAHWTLAKAWLRRELSERSEDASRS